MGKGAKFILDFWPQSPLRRHVRRLPETAAAHIAPRLAVDTFRPHIVLTAKTLRDPSFSISVFGRFLKTLLLTSISSALEALAVMRCINAFLHYTGRRNTVETTSPAVTPHLAATTRSCLTLDLPLTICGTPHCDAWRALRSTVCQAVQWVSECAFEALWYRNETTYVKSSEAPMIGLYHSKFDVGRCPKLWDTGCRKLPLPRKRGPQKLLNHQQSNRGLWNFVESWHVIAM